MVLIVTWNVAGLSSTVHRICKHYKPPTTSSDASSSTKRLHEVHRQESTPSDDYYQDGDTIQDANDDDDQHVIGSRRTIQEQIDINNDRNELHSVMDVDEHNQDRNKRKLSSLSFVSSSSSSLSDVNNQPQQVSEQASEKQHQRHRNQKQHHQHQQQQQQQQNPSAPVCYYFSQLHQADIICLQEHKISKSTLSNRLEHKQCSTLRYVPTRHDNSDSTNDHVIEYESFWSCCIDDKFKGFNGVVTYVRKGMVSKANGTTILGNPELDHQGRCVMTDHGTFLLYNVYVPNTCGQSLSYKMKFLHALRRSMQQQRKIQQKPIILVGDLNITHTANDVYWEDRLVSIDHIMDEVHNKIKIHDNNTPRDTNRISGHETVTISETTNPNITTHEIPQWKFDVVNYWPMIESILKTQQVIETQTTNSITKEKYTKYRVAVDVPITVSAPPTASIITIKDEDHDDNTSVTMKTTTKRVLLGKYESDPDYCSHCYNFDTYSYYDEDRKEHIVARKRNMIPVGILSELMSKIANVTWPMHVQRSIESDVDVMSPTRRWFHQILQEDHMIDTFRYYYPHAQSRFTCWNQYTNQRYSNIGARIDYMLVDKELLNYIQKGKILMENLKNEQVFTKNMSFLRCGCNRRDLDRNDPSTYKRNHYHCHKSSDCEEAALCAATAGGKYIPASFDGGGIIEATQNVLDIQFNGTLHTGHIYTPPTFSDHIAISTLFSDDILMSTQQVLQHQDPLTKKAQPHKLQTSIATFFGNNSNKKTGATVHDNTIKVCRNENNVQSLTKSSFPISPIAKHKILPAAAQRGNRTRLKVSSKESILHHFKTKKT